MTGPSRHPTGARVLHARSMSFVVPTRAGQVALVLTGLLVGLGLLSLTRGDYPIPAAEVARAVIAETDPAVEFVVTTLRLPRLVTAILVGAALGLAGALTQAVTRNPLASPDVLGVTSGAAAAAVAVLVLPVGLPVPVAAVLGGFGTAAVIGVLAYRGGLAGSRILLVGVGVGAVATSLTTYLLVRGEINEVAQASRWLAGSLESATWAATVPPAIGLLLAVPVLAAVAGGLSPLRFGDDAARGLGVPVTAVRGAALAGAVGLAATATAAAGPVGFVALLAPQVALRLTRQAALPLLGSALTGSVLTVLADLLARHAWPGTVLPVGAVTALAGAPLLLVLVRRVTRGGAA